MKSFYYLTWGILVSLLMGGCQKNDAVTYDTDYFPRIFDRTGAFTSPSRIISEGETAEFNGFLFSPASKVAVSWKVNGQEMSTDSVFHFTPSGGGEFTVSLEVTNAGQTASRSTKVLVNPTNYTLKPYTNVALEYLTATGSAADVDWSTVTHVAFNCARVTPEGGLDVTVGLTDQAADELVARAHIAGVAVLLGVSGTLSGIDGWALYESQEFGSSIVNATHRSALITRIVNYVVDRRMDGVDIMMTDINNGGAYSAYLAALGPFLTELKAALPEGKLLTTTVTPAWQNGFYPNLSMVDWVHVRGFENGVHVGPNAPLGQPSPFDYMVSAANIWLNNHGIPANKIVLGMPAFGLRYNELNEDGNNLSWGSYAYVPYRDILALDESAYGKEYISVAKGIYFNGIPLVTEKADYVKANGFKGAYLYGGNYDVQGERSLMRAIYQILN